MAILGVNHIAFRTPDVARLRAFYTELLGGEALDGAHDPVRVGSTLLVFFASDGNPISADPDEIAFDADAPGFEAAYERAKALGVVTKDIIEHSAWSKGFVVRDPDGRRIEVTYDDRSVYWRE